ncbi:hypothetical protein PHYPSEUDO_009965 [Phytophthora pseudosyringae]|uniref:Uncharacterized protein n=1 Tax=Phytophthora pseudosyringae TaxID=221518 RepID=A0A8T1VB11_9STRA|nr:hypothetical protein PHYPSEUDO_009965 [Phytophthora pseudosyringae]
MFSIFATQPTQFTLSRHFHEFRHVHAIQTMDMADAAGIVTYTQGFTPYIENTLKDNALSLPLPRLHESDHDVTPVTVLAMLEFPNVDTMNGTFKSPEYQATSGAHVFANPEVIYITESLESLAEQARTFGLVNQSSHAYRGLSRARLVFALAPQSTSPFKTQWDDHATLVHKLIGEFVCQTEALPLSQLPMVEYQRQISSNMTQEQLDGVLDGSPFRQAKYRVTNGGYEELAFLHMGLLVSFVKLYGDQLRASFTTFVDMQPAVNSTPPSFAIICDETRIVDSTTS